MTSELDESTGSTQIAGSSPEALPPSSSSYKTGVSLSVVTLTGSAGPSCEGTAEAAVPVSRTRRNGSARDVRRGMKVSLGQAGTHPGERQVKGRRRARNQATQRRRLVVLTRSHASTAAAS